MADKRFIRTNPIDVANFEIKRGVYNSFGFDVLQSDEVTPFDMRTYSGARLSVKANGMETVSALELTTADGEITLLDGSVLWEFPEAKTGIIARPYSYDFYVTDAGNEIVFLSGVLKVNQNY